MWISPEVDVGDAPRNLYAASIANSRPALVVTNISEFHWQRGVNISISNGIVVWVEGNERERTLRAKNLRTGEALTVATGEVGYPAIAGHMVSWWEGYEVHDTETARQPAILKSRDLASMSEPVVLA